MNAEDKIYEAYFKSKESRMYFNQLKKETKLSHSSLQNVLDKLVKNKILSLEKKTSNVFYEIRDKKLFSLKFSEIALSKFDSLHFEIQAPLKNFLKEISNSVFTVVIFGSASKSEHGKESDVDLLIVEDKKADYEKLKNEINNFSNYPLSLFKCSVEQFCKNKDPVIIQARKTGFPIYHEQNFYEVSLNEPE